MKFDQLHQQTLTEKVESSDGRKVWLVLNGLYFLCSRLQFGSLRVVLQWGPAMCLLLVSVHFPSVTV